MADTPEVTDSAASTDGSGPVEVVAPPEAAAAAPEAAPAPAVESVEAVAGEAATASQSASEAPSEAVPEAPSGAPEGATEAPAEAGISATAPASDQSEASSEASSEATAEGVEGAEGAEGAEGQAGPAKRKRKRRRKKKEGTSPGEIPAEGAPAPRARKKESHAPFVRFFTGALAGRRHAFAVGEVVAGRVTQCQEGAISVDLFGKATAYVDEHEPREIPPQPAPEPPPAAPLAAEVTEVAAVAPEAPAAPEAEQTAGGQEGQAPAVADTSPEGPEATVEALVTEPAVQPNEATELVAEAPVEPTTDPESTEADPPEVPLEGAPSEEAEASEEAAEAPGGPVRPKGPLEVAPVVPADLPRQELPTLGHVFKGRVAGVSESGHVVLVNRNVNQAEARAAIETFRQERRRVEGLVFGFNRGGFDVLVAGVRAFCPASAMALEDIEDPQQYLGVKYEFLLPANKSDGKDVVISRRSIIEREQRKKAKELLKGLKPGQKFKGRVTSVREFGLFVDIGGVEGLVHQSEISYAHGARPEDLAKPGDEVDVQVLRVGGEPAGKDKERGARKDRLTRVSLSIKALLDDPWDAHADAIAEGTVVVGKVTRTTDFGAFLELAPNVEGLLHISELGRGLKHANLALKEGEEVHVVVERTDRKTRRLSLSKLSPAEIEDFKSGKLTDLKDAPRLKQGSKLMVKVDKVDKFGIVVRVEGAIGRKARGFIPNVETGTERGTDHRKMFPIGKEIEIKIVGTDRDGGLRCSIKALAMDEERAAIRDYRREASKQGFGTFGDLLKAKLGGDES